MPGREMVMLVSQIKPNPNNPRLIKDDKFKKLVQSIKDFPDMLNKRPIVVNKDMIVLGGNMRLKACIEAGMKEVPVIVADWSEEQQREFIIKDNVSGGEWDWDVLANEWDAEQLTEWGLDVPDIQQLEAHDDDFEAPEGGLETDIVLGDLFEIGEHRLLCGDSTDSDAVAKLMDGEKADMVFTDPPYGMNLDTNYADIYKNSIANVKNQDKIIGDDKEFNFLDFYALFEYVKEQFWWGADYYQNQLPSNGGIFVWDKVCESMEGRIGNEFELCWSKQRHKKEIIHIKWAGFLGLQKEDGKRQHPTQKPIRLCESFISRFSKESNLLVDPFIGSGSTMVAAHQLKRKCYGMELDPKYCQVIVDRMLKLDPTLTVKRNGKKYVRNNVETTTNA
jgi:DNA modification methylase